MTTRERLVLNRPNDLGWADLTAVTEQAADSVDGELLARIMHVSDAHVCDAESPARMEYLDRLSDPDSILRRRLGVIGTYRPQEILTVQVLAAMVEAINGYPDPLDAVIVTGDLIDNAQRNERDWFTRVLDGGSVEAWSGDSGVSQWVGSIDGYPWDERYWHPDGPKGAMGDDLPTRRFGYPRIPGLVAAARAAVLSPGLAAPWFAVPGNHDALLQGTVAADIDLRELAVGDRRVVGLPRGASPLLTLEGVAPIGPARYIHDDRSPEVPATPDGRRRLLTADELQGPWVRDMGRVRFVAMDTVNPAGGWQGSIGDAQFRWLQATLDESADRYVVVLSHHPSWTLINSYTDSEPRHLAAEVVDLLRSSPQVIAWLAGHVHAHTSLWHGDGDRGFWEITTSSLIDWPQQARAVEFLRVDGRIALRSTLVDHAGRRSWSADAIGERHGLAAVSRVLAANDYRHRDGVRQLREGTDQDRNSVWWLADPHS